MIISYRNEDGIDVLFITDITKNGEKATKANWEFTLLEKQMEEGTLQLLRFNLLDIQVIKYVEFHHVPICFNSFLLSLEINM